MDVDNTRGNICTIFANNVGLEKLKSIAEGNSLIEGANHIREGIVVRPIVDRFTYEIGRLQLKIISNAYLEHE